MDEIKIIKKLLEGKSKEQKIEFCNQCLEEPEKYTPHRIKDMEKRICKLEEQIKNRKKIYPFDD